MTVSDIHELTKCLHCGYTGIYNYFYLKDSNTYHVVINLYKDLLDGMLCIGPRFTFWVPYEAAEYPHKYNCHNCGKELSLGATEILDELAQGPPKITLYGLGGLYANNHQD